MGPDTAPRRSAIARRAGHRAPTCGAALKRVPVSGRCLSAVASSTGSPAPEEVPSRSPRGALPNTRPSPPPTAARACVPAVEQGFPSARRPVGRSPGPGSGVACPRRVEDPLLPASCPLPRELNPLSNTGDGGAGRWAEVRGRRQVAISGGARPRCGWPARRMETFEHVSQRRKINTTGLVHSRDDNVTDLTSRARCGGSLTALVRPSCVVVDQRGEASAPTPGAGRAPLRGLVATPPLSTRRGAVAPGAPRSQIRAAPPTPAPRVRRAVFTDRRRPRSPDSTGSTRSARPESRRSHCDRAGARIA